MFPTYSVVTYSADGDGRPERLIRSGLSLEAAKELADLGFGSWLPEDDDPDGRNCIGYHESDAEGCGGRMVRREDG